MRSLKASLHALTDACVRVLAALGVLSLVLGLMTSRWDGAWLWSRGDALPSWAVSALVVVFAGVLLFGPRVHPAGRFLARCLGVVVAVACLADAISVFRDLGSLRVASVAEVPPSAFVAALLLLWVATAGSQPYSSESRTRRALWLSVVDRSSR